MLEKILDEIEEATRQEDAPIYCGSMEVDGYVRMSRVKDIIRKHMNDGWIPCDVRLPEDLIDVEVTRRDGERDIAYYLGNPENIWIDVERDIPVDVIAWKEPSNPYRPEKGARKNDKSKD